VTNNTQKILVVDDQSSVRVTLSGIMEDQGYDVTEAEDGYRAIDASRETAFDLIFMDVMMPGINGVQTFREIKKINPKSVVVLMTGYSGPVLEDLLKDALEEGAFSVIYKPLNIGHLISIVESVPRAGSQSGG